MLFTKYYFLNSDKFITESIIFSNVDFVGKVVHCKLIL